MSGGLQPGDRVLDLRAVARSAGLFAGLFAAPVAAGLSGQWWVWCVLAAVTAAVVGLLAAGVVSRVAFPAPPGQAVVTRVGPASLAVALRASMMGGSLVSIACAVAALVGAGGIPASASLLAGLGAAAGVGCLAALV
jgi:hypothetical protein